MILVLAEFRIKRNTEVRYWSGYQCSLTRIVKTHEIDNLYVCDASFFQVVEQLTHHLLLWQMHFV